MVNQVTRGHEVTHGTVELHEAWPQGMPLGTTQGMTWLGDHGDIMRIYGKKQPHYIHRYSYIYIRNNYIKKIIYIIILSKYDIYIYIIYIYIL